MRGLEGQIVGKYELVREIGHGNMGTVYLGRDTFSLRDVAVKVATPKPTNDERLARRRSKLFFNEVKAASLLRHPNIVSIVDAGEADDKRYLAMEYVQGAQTLDRFCSPSDLLSFGRVLEIMLKCALAFGYAHERGVVHRDIKPRNILLTQDNEVKICDFGVALIDRADVDETQVMGTLGSPRYMAPEQLLGDAITSQIDIFSLGLVTYELLTGEHPFSASTIPAVAKRIMHEKARPVRDIRPQIPAALSRIVDRAIAKKPADRYRTAMDLAGDLSLIHDDLRVSTEDLSNTGRFHQVKALEFFRGFEESDVLAIVAASMWEQHPAGREIVAEGTAGDAFYVLVSGDVTVRCGGVDVDVLKSGASFGETGFILGLATTAHIVARTDVTLLKIPAAVIEHTSINCQLRFQKAFLRTMATRLANSMSFISKRARRRAQGANAS